MKTINNSLVNKIKQEVNHAHLVDVNEYTKKTDYVLARYQYYSLLSEFTTLDKESIANTIKQTKTTYLNSLRKHNELIYTDSVYRLKYNELFAKIKTSLYDYEKMYKSLLKDYENLEARYRQLKTEHKAILVKFEKPKLEKQNDHVERVKEVVNEYFNTDISIKIRKQEFVIGRAIYSAILFKTTSMLHGQIAKTLDLDRSTIYNSMSNHEDWIEFDKVYKKDYETILRQIENEEQRQTNNN